ncbi:MAG: DUF3237 domain-containing protein [Chloroflexia bacterium]|nr:DUF3237 domain-containing protein [Chloroflexia bacterium]
MIAIATIQHATPPASRVQLEHLFTCKASLRIPRDAIGDTPEGLQLGFTLTGGEVVGPRLNGTLRSIGSDWLTICPGGTGLLDLRIAIETDDDALIYAPYQGPLDHGKAGYERAVRGSLLTKRTSFQIAPQFQSHDTGYQWINGLRCLGLGQVFPERGEARCAFYAIHSGDQA